MRVFNPLVRCLAVGVPIAVLAGCEPPTGSESAAPPGGASWQQSVNMKSEFGGYSFSSESQAFGDPALLKMESEEKATTTVDADSVPGDSTFAVRILWGQLAGNPGATAEIDWSGSVSVSRGGVAVLRTIAFEWPGDHIVMPRGNRQTVQFVSHTKPDFDGLLLMVHDVPGADPTTFTFTTPPYTHTWTLAELKTANLVVPVDSLGNAVSITGTPRKHRECPSGFTRGFW